MASLNCRVYASSSEEQSSRDQRLRSAKLDEDASTTNLREGERTLPRPAEDGAAEVGGVPAVGPEGDAGGSTHRNRREKGGKNAALARDARAQPGSSDGSAPSRPSRENEQPNSSAAGPSVGIGAASAAGANDASLEEGWVEESNDGVQRKTPAELLAAGQEGAASHDAAADQGAAELVETLLAGPLGWVLLPKEQWPERFRQLYDAGTTGNIVAPFVKRQPEYESLQRKVEEGRHLVTFDSFTHDWLHCYIPVFLNFNSDRNPEAWLKRLLWPNRHGHIGESCLKAVIDLLVNIFVKCHNARREYAEFAVRECTVFMDRTLETGKHNWCDGDLSSFLGRVAVTDGDTCALARKCARKFPREALPVILGEHSYKAIGLGVGQSDGPWLKGTGLQLSQTGKMSHPVRLTQPWQSEREMIYNLLVWKALASILVGRPAAQLTKEEDRKLMPFATTAGGIAYAKRLAKDAGEFLWAMSRCVKCGATSEGSLEGYYSKTDGGKGKKRRACSGIDGQGCRGCLDEKGGYKTKYHKEWEPLGIIECLNCCKEDPWAMGRLRELKKSDGSICNTCFCYDCKPDHPANKKRKECEEREEEKEERAAKRQRKAEERAAEKQRKAKEKEERAAEKQRKAAEKEAAKQRKAAEEERRRRLDDMNGKLNTLAHQMLNGKRQSDEFVGALASLGQNNSFGMSASDLMQVVSRKVYDT